MSGQDSIRTVIVSQIEQLRVSSKNGLLPLTDDLNLLDTGLDSLGVAVLVVRLDDALGIDPFGQLTSLPATLGDLISLYENAAQAQAQAA